MCQLAKCPNNTGRLPSIGTPLILPPHAFLSVRNEACTTEFCSPWCSIQCAIFPDSTELTYLFFYKPICFSHSFIASSFSIPLFSVCLVESPVNVDDPHPKPLSPSPSCTPSSTPTQIPSLLIAKSVMIIIKTSSEQHRICSPRHRWRTSTWERDSLPHHHPHPRPEESLLGWSGKS